MLRQYFCLILLFLNVYVYGFLVPLQKRHLINQKSSGVLSYYQRNALSRLQYLLLKVLPPNVRHQLPHNNQQQRLPYPKRIQLLDQNIFSPKFVLFQQPHSLPNSLSHQPSTISNSNNKDNNLISSYYIKIPAIFKGQKDQMLVHRVLSNSGLQKCELFHGSRKKYTCTVVDQMCICNLLLEF